MHSFAGRVVVAAGTTLILASPALAQKAKLAPFSGEATAAAAFTRVEGTPVLGGAKVVAIPQFTVEFVSRSDGLSAKEERRQDYVRVDYALAGIGDAERQRLTDQLYAAWVKGLEARGIRVLGPRQVAATGAWSKVSNSLRAAPADVQRDSGINRLFSVEGAGFLMPIGARVPEGEASRTVDTGAAVASRVGGKMGGMFGLGRGLMKMGSGLKAFGSEIGYAAAEAPLAREAGAAVMSVRLVVGLRDTDMASRGFGLFRTASTYDGKPRLVIQADGTEVAITSPDGKTRAGRLLLTNDLVFNEDLLGGRIALANDAGRTVTNTLAKANFAARAVGGGSATIDQVHHFTARVEPASFEAAVARNLVAVQSALLARVGG